MPCSACGKSGLSSARNNTPFILNNALRRNYYNKSVGRTNPRIVRQRIIRKTLLFNLK